MVSVEVRLAQDTAQDQRGFIIVLDDEDLAKLIDARANDDNDEIFRFMSERYGEIS